MDRKYTPEEIATMTPPEIIAALNNPLSPIPGLQFKIEAEVVVRGKDGKIKGRQVIPWAQE